MTRFMTLAAHSAVTLHLVVIACALYPESWFSLLVGVRFVLVRCKRSQIVGYPYILGPAPKLITGNRFSVFVFTLTQLNYAVHCEWK